MQQLDEPQEVITTDADGGTRKLRLVGPHAGPMPSPSPSAVLHLPTVTAEQSLQLATTASVTGTTPADGNLARWVGNDVSMLNKRADGSTRAVKADLPGEAPPCRLHWQARRPRDLDNCQVTAC